MSAPDIVATPWCVAVLPEPWDAPPGRFFAAYRARGAARWLLGQGVLDEFRTVSSPLFVAPAPLLGDLYDAGLTLAFRRDPELPLDAGWPPLCLGVDAPAPALGPGWQEELLAALQGRQDPAAAPEALRPRVEERTAGPHRITRVEVADVELLLTDAPLLPEQLEQLCAGRRAALTLALSIGNRLTRSDGGRPQPVTVASQAGVAALAAALEGR